MGKKSVCKEENVFFFKDLRVTQDSEIWKKRLAWVPTTCQTKADKTTIAGQRFFFPLALESGNESGVSEEIIVFYTLSLNVSRVDTC